MVRADSIFDLACAPLTRLEKYWQDLRGGRSMPARAEVDPAEIRDLLPLILMTRIEHDPLRIKYTIVGTTSVQASGTDFTGRYLDELHFESETDTDWSAIYAELVREKRPIAGHCVFHTAGDDFTYPVGVFPLSNDDNRVDHAIAYEHLTLNLVELDNVLTVKKLT